MGKVAGRVCEDPARRAPLTEANPNDDHREQPRALAQPRRTSHRERALCRLRSHARRGPALLPAVRRKARSAPPGLHSFLEASVFEQRPRGPIGAVSDRRPRRLAGGATGRLNPSRLSLWSVAGSAFAACGRTARRSCARGRNPRRRCARTDPAQLTGGQLNLGRASACRAGCERRRVAVGGTGSSVTRHRRFHANHREHTFLQARTYPCRIEQSGRPLFLGKLTSQRIL